MNCELPSEILTNDDIAAVHGHEYWRNEHDHDVDDWLEAKRALDDPASRGYCDERRRRETEGRLSL